MNLRTLDVVVASLLVIGGLNWGLWGLFELDLIAVIFGSSTAIGAKVVYAIVGVAALYQVASLRAIQRRWNVRPSVAPA